MIFGRKQVTELKMKYRVGTRIRLIRMDDAQAPPAGTEGTVTGVDDVGSVLMNWDNGCGLNLIPDEDDFEIVEDII